MYESILFDLDGTLWDTAAICAEAWNAAIRSTGRAYRPITRDDIVGAMGLAADEFRAKVLWDLPAEEGRTLLRKSFEYEIEFLKRHIPTYYPGVIEGIETLAKTHRLFIVSNCDVEYLRAFIKSSGLRAHFTDSECHGGTQLTKAENIVLILKRNQIQSAVYVGDTPGDQRAAAQAGIPFAYVNYGFGKCESYEHCFSSFGELVKVFGVTQE
jgi:phosphoglycolate phosphatase